MSEKKMREIRKYARDFEESLIEFFNPKDKEKFRLRKKLKQFFYKNRRLPI